MNRAPAVEIDLNLTSLESKIHLSGTGRKAHVHFDSLSGALLLFRTAWVWTEPLHQLLRETGVRLDLRYHGRLIKTLEEGSNLLWLLRLVKGQKSDR